MTIRISLLVDSPSQRAHGNAMSRLALGLFETGETDTTIVCYSDDPAPRWLPQAVRVHRLPVNRVSRATPSLVTYLRTFQPHVLITRQVHANFVGLLASALARTPPPWKGKLVLAQDHPVELSHASNWRDNKWMAKVAYRFADGLIAPSPTVRENIVSWCGIDMCSTAVIPIPIPPPVSSSAPIPHPWLLPGEPPVLLNASNMTPWKRLDLLIQAFAELCTTHEARLLVLGDGSGRSGAAELIRRLGISSRAQILGWVEDPLLFARHAWAFVLTSDEEGFSQVLTESMSVGCPVITTDALGGGPRFVTDDGGYGLLVRRDDLDEVVAAMRAMLDPQVRSEYAALGLERAAALRPEASATALVEFLRTQLRVAA